MYPLGFSGVSIFGSAAGRGASYDKTEVHKLPYHPIRFYMAFENAYKA